MLQLIMASSSSTKRAFLYLANSSLHSNPRYYPNCVACFCSASNKIQGGNISEGDTTRVGGNKKTRLEKSNQSRVVAEDAVEIAKAGVVGAVEVGLKFGEMTKQIGDGLWDTAKRTAESVRDSVDNHHQTSNKHNVTQEPRRPAGDFHDHLKDDFNNRYP